MYDGADLIRAAYEEMDRLDSLTEQMREEGIQRDEAERVYRIKRREQTLIESHRGAKMAVIERLVDGSEEIAYLRREFQDWDNAYWTTKQAIANATERLRFYRQLIEMEQR